MPDNHPEKETLFTSESVTEGHPDKLCDQIADAILDEIISKETELEARGYISPDSVPASVENMRCACEVFATTGLIVIGGEIRTQAWVDVQEIARKTIKRIGYDRAKYGFDGDTCGVINTIHSQSPDIAQGVDNANQNDVNRSSDKFDQVGAGDQGMMFGYATNETPTLMPAPHYIASRLAERLASVRKDGTLDYLRPDGKTQVTMRYVDNKPVAVDTIVISTQHAPEIDDMSIIKNDMIQHVITPVLDAVGYELPNEDHILVNPTGRFVIGGPHGDTGLTGRKVIVDTYGGAGRHGGGAFSGKDCTKVDRSASYYARYVAKNIVAAGLAERCEVQVSYAIGVSKPTSISVNTFGAENTSQRLIEGAVKEVFDFRPAAIIEQLDLRRPIYEKTAAYGHFGREDEDFAWEKTDRVDALKEYVEKHSR